MKQMKRLTRDQKAQLVKEGKDPKEYACVYKGSSTWVFVRKDGKQDDMADREEGCRK